MNDVLQLPIEAIQERDGVFYCAIPKADGGIETREIQLGKGNETSLIVSQVSRLEKPSFSMWVMRPFLIRWSFPTLPISHPKSRDEETCCLMSEINTAGSDAAQGCVASERALQRLPT